MILGRNAAARELGMSPQCLGKAFSKGRIKQTADGLYDVEACRIALKLNSNPGKQANAKKQKRGPQKQKRSPETGSSSELPPPPEPKHRAATADPQPEEEEGEGGVSYSEAVRRREWIRVEKEQLNLEKQRLSLVELTPVNAYVAGMIMQAREELIRIPMELRDKLAQELDPIKCQEMLLDRIDQTLKKMSEFKPSPA